MSIKSVKLKSESFFLISLGVLELWRKNLRGGGFHPPSPDRVNMYSMGACSALRIRNQEALSEDIENDPFLNSALQRFSCELFYRFGSFLAPLIVGIITSRHYLSERNKNGERGTGDNKNGGGKKTAE